MADYTINDSNSYRSLIKNVSVKYLLKDELVAEFKGTFILCLSIFTSIISQTISNQIQSRNFDSFQINLSIALGLLIAIITCGHVSGHFNPAVTVTMVIRYKCPTSKMGYLFLAQFLGAYLAAFVSYFNYYDFIQRINEIPHLDYMRTAGVFITQPQNSNLSTLNLLLDECLSSGLLIYGILCINDENNPNIPKRSQPFLISLLLLLILQCFSENSGASMNPVRDFAPRLFLWMIGYGSQVFSSYNYYFWIPLIGPIIGGIIAAYIYDFNKNYLYKTD